MGSSQLFEVLGKAAGIGGIAVGVFGFLFRDFIRKSIFPNLTKQQSYRLLLLFLCLTFGIALAGITAWVLGPRPSIPASEKAKEPDESFRRVFYEGFDGAVDGTIWLVGKQDDWEGKVVDGTYRLCNATQTATASFTDRLAYAESKEGHIDQSNAQVSIQVRVQPPNVTHSAAGILFRASRDKKRYLAFVLNAGGVVSLLRREDTSIKVLWSKEIGIRSDFVSLRVVGKGTSIDLYVDNVRVHSARESSMERGDPGIFAYGLGCFIFDNYGVYLPV